MPPLWSSKAKGSSWKISDFSKPVDSSATKWFPAETTSMLLRSSAFSVTEWRSSQRRRADSRHNDIEETNRPRPMTYNTSVSEFNIVTMHVSCDVLLPALLPARRGLTNKRRVVCQPNFGWQLWRRNGYICVYFTGPQAQIPSSPYQQGMGLVRGYGFTSLKCKPARNVCENVILPAVGVVKGFWRNGELIAMYSCCNETWTEKKVVSCQLTVAAQSLGVLEASSVNGSATWRFRWLFSMHAGQQKWK